MSGIIRLVLIDTAATPAARPIGTTGGDFRFDFDSGDLTPPQAAQLLREDPSDPHALDRDGDGVACDARSRP